LLTSFVGLFLLLPAVLRVFICLSLLPNWYVGYVTAPSSVRLASSMCLLLRVMIQQRSI
jgi:hypothetical protein